MNKYNFGILSPLRFEQLTRDLLKNQYGIFENFAEGKDGGIDFRCSQSENKILIVQCKKYKDVSNLLTNLKKESKKLDNLVFTDYILVVSLDLTEKNKTEILKIFNGKIKNPNQIITNSDLNYLLGFPENQYIEVKYPELWMGSIHIHQKIFQLGFLQHSQFIKDKLSESIKNFVPFKEYYELIEHFKYHNVAIISGNAGMGKTTLSYATISKFIFFENYQLVDLSYRQIQEAENSLYSNQPAIFLIDDFLGRIKLEKGNEYAQLLLHFIEKIEKSSDQKLIVTSREYILKKAHTELLAVEEMSQNITKYVIELSSLTRRIRTEILYNHLKNSTLLPNFIDNFFQNNFKAIIDHRNYNPRIIEHLTNAKMLQKANIKAENYFDFFIENLENPQKVWESIYNNLPNDLYKLVLLVRFLLSETLYLPSKMPLERLAKAIKEFIDKEPHYQYYSYDSFEYIIREMEGTFFKLGIDYDDANDNEYTIIEFQNPSIMDFINNFIWKKKDWLELIIKNAIYFEVLFNSKLLEMIQEDDYLKSVFRNKILKTDFNSMENAGIGYFVCEAKNESFDCYVSTRYRYYLSELIQIIDIKRDIELAKFIKTELFRYIIDPLEDISERIAFSEVVVVLLEMGLADSETAIKYYTPNFDCYFFAIKDFVYLEDITRFCTPESIKLITNNKKIREIADELFLDEIENIESEGIDFVSLLDFFDDFEQIKSILPLKKASKKLKTLNHDAVLQKGKESSQNADDQETATEPDKKNDYYDIDDKSIEDIFADEVRKISTEL